MENNNEFKRINVKKRTCYYFDDITEDGDIIVNNILLDKKSYKNILSYNMLYKIFMDAKLIRFNKVNGLIVIYDWIRYLELSDSYNEVYYGINSRVCNKIFDRINYLLSKKGGITDSLNHNFARIRIDSYISLPIGKALTFHNVIILIESVVNQSKNNYYYYYNIFLEKGLYKEIHDAIFLIECLYLINVIFR